MNTSFFTKHKTPSRSTITALLALFAIGASVAFIAGAFFGDVRIADADACDARHDLVPVTDGPWHPGPGSEINIDIANGSALVRVKNISETCSYTVNLASYNIFDPFGTPDFITNQTLFDVKTRTLGPGETKSFSVSLPSCNMQVDLFEGPIVPQNNPDFANPPLKGVDHLLVWESDYSQGLCTIPPPPPPSVCTPNAFAHLVPVGGGSWHPGPNSEIVLSGDTATVDVKNISTLCTYTINLATYEIHAEFGAPDYLSSQVLFDVETVIIGPGETKTLSVDAPSCNFQSDAFEGTIVPQSNPDFANPPLAGADHLFVWESDRNRGLCGAPLPATLTLVKTVINNDGGTATPNDFNLRAQGGSQTYRYTSGQTRTLPVGSYTAQETNLPGYTAGVWTGDCAANGIVTLNPGDAKTCYITNNDIPGTPSPATLKLIKTVINDDGGTATANDFNLRAQTGDMVYSYTSGQKRELPAGTYIAKESNLTGYTAGTWVGDCATNGTVTLNPGDNKVCRITNNDIPAPPPPPNSATLRIIKVVINDDGGIATPNDFNLRAEGVTQNYTYTSGQERVLPVGTYTAKETNISGYTAGSWTGDCSANGAITLNAGDNKVCRITNNDVPASPPPPQTATLRIVKTVINDDGGTATVDDFNLRAQGGSQTYTYTSGQTRTLPVGSYTAKETNLAGYTAGSWTGDCSANGAITLNAGDNKVCRITNNDIPTTSGQPFCTLSINPTSIVSGGSATLSWTSGNIASASIDQGIGTITLPNGSQSVSPTATTTYTGTFNATNGSVLTCSATLGVTTTNICILPSFASDTYQASGIIGQPFSYTIPTPSGSAPLTVVASNLPSGLSASGNTISGTPNETGTFDVTLTAENSCGLVTAKLFITITTPGCTSGCGGGGSNPPTVVLFGKPGDNPLVLSSFVYLSQVPYTGLGTSALQVILFILGLGVLATLIAYGALTLRPLRRLRTLLRSYILGDMVTENTVPNLKQAPVAHTEVEASIPQETHTEIPPELSKVMAPHTQNSLSTQKTDYPQVDSNTIEKLATTIIDNAKREYALLSEDAGRLIAETADGVALKADKMISDVLSIAKTRYPRENGWLILDTARVRESLFVSFLSTVPLFVRWIIEGENKKVFAFLRLLKRQSQPVSEFVQKVVSDLGAVHRARLEGTLEQMGDSELVSVVYELSNSELEGMVHDLLSGVDETYESSYTAVRLALVGILERMRARSRRTVQGAYEFKSGVNTEPISN